ncbi:MAG: hypothetical protein IJE10_10490 [Clostridia bacterium]|nr:hypothetical protein [Clostridia bacterium]
MVYGAIDKKSETGYTYLKKIFRAMNGKQKEYNWLITNQDCYPKDMEMWRFFNNRDYLWISGEELSEIIEQDDFQWVWGMLCGFDQSVSLEQALQHGLPQEADYEHYFEKPLRMQFPFSQTEIVPFDSTYVLFLSRHKEQVESFRKNYPNSTNLAEYCGR